MENERGTVAFHTLGCKLNFAETSTIARDFTKEGYQKVGFVEPSDIYVINTCSVTENADKECRTVVRSALKRNPDAFVIIVGCYAQLKSEEIAQMEGVDLVLGATEKFKITQYLEDLSKKDFGDIKKTSEISASDFDVLAMPGGFGTAKNLTKWAFSGPDGEILPEIKNLILDFVAEKKIILGMCMSPTTIAKALQGTEYQAHLTVGSTNEKSPYEIDAISEGINSVGAVAEMKTVRELSIDKNLRIITAPCYMMEASITEVYENIVQAVEALDGI